MKLLLGDKDGGPESLVWCWGIESKRFGSILLLKFKRGSREAFHTHAFNSVSWVLKGRLREVMIDGFEYNYWFSLYPIHTHRDTFHKVIGLCENNWVLTLRGPWANEWKEFIPKTKRFLKLTHGRKEC